jgi:type IV pilus assembly protein PilW
MIARRAGAARGFTLVELIVAMGATAVLVAGAVTLAVQQQRAYQAGGQDRALEESARVALGEVTGALREAGYGVDTQLVFDFGEIANVELTALPPAYTRVRAWSYACTTPVDCRDSTDGPDELVFLRRNPLFSRRLAGVGADEIQLTGDLRTPLRRGQLLQVMCLTGAQVRAYVTVGAEVLPAATWSATGTVTVPLIPGAQDFPNQTAFLTEPCFAQESVVVKVERHRYRIETYDAAGDVVAWGTPGARPWLLLDTGTFATGPDGVERPVEVPVAPDVEDLQVVYLYPPNVPSEVNRLVGAEEGVLASAGAFHVDVGIPPPRNDAPPDHASRRTGSPGNIQAVRVAIVVRTPEPDLSYHADADRELPAAGNRPALLGPTGHRRALYESTVPVYNMQSRYLAYPMVDPGGGRGFNVGGG